MLYPSGPGGASASVKVKNTSEGPTLDTTSSGGSGPATTLGRSATDGDISRGYTEEIEHFCWCVRNSAPENKPRCRPEVAMADAIIALTSNIAIKERKQIAFKPEWFDIHSDETPEGVAPRKV
jgi:hypothetical protein